MKQVLVYSAQLLELLHQFVEGRESLGELQNQWKLTLIMTLIVSCLMQWAFTPKSSQEMASCFLLWKSQTNWFDMWHMCAHCTTDATLKFPTDLRHYIRNTFGPLELWTSLKNLCLLHIHNQKLLPSSFCEQGVYSFSQWGNDEYCALGPNKK